jgi:hypothetical protein
LSADRTIKALNRLPFSCRKRAMRYFQNSTISREAVGWNFHDRKRSLLSRETVRSLTVSQKRRVGRQHTPLVCNFEIAIILLR